MQAHIEAFNTREELLLKARTLARRSRERIWELMGEHDLPAPHIWHGAGGADGMAPRQGRALARSTPGAALESLDADDLLEVARSLAPPGFALMPTPGARPGIGLESMPGPVLL